MKDWLGTFHFLRPEWLWVLLAVPLIYFAHRIRENVRAQWEKVIDPELLDHLLLTKRSLWRFRPIHMICLGITLSVIGLAGPAWRREQPPFTEDKAPLVVALDLSETMDAIDVDPTRLERAKLKLKDLLKLRRGSQTALFAYAGTAHLVVPLTTDEDLFELYLDSLSTSLMPRKGKDTPAALTQMEDLLQRESVPGTILFVTDGVEGRAVERLRTFVEKGEDEVLVLAVGTSRGGPVRLSENHFLNDSAGRRVFSKLDLGALKSLKDIGIPVTTLTLDDDDIHWVQRRAQSHLQQVQEKNTQSRWIDEGYWLTIPVALLAVFWFRRGWSVRWSFSTAMLIIFPFQVGGPQHFRFIDLWLTPDQQGRYYFQKGDYKTAAERFEDPMWRGMALARAGDDAAAVDQFSMEDSAEAWYNQGNALAHLKKYPEAVAAYEQALSRRHPWLEAQENLELVRSLIPAKKPDKQEEEQELPPDMKPDEMKFDEKGKQGQRKQLSIDPAKMADIWMRNIQTSPADFLRRRFAIQAAEHHP